MIYDQNDPDVLIGMTGESQLIKVAWGWLTKLWRLDGPVLAWI
jgi:hypothetical protein